MPFIQRSTSVFENPQIHQKWRQAWQTKEDALYERHMKNSAALSEHSKTLFPLTLGCKVFIQNQDKSSKYYKKWNRTGTVKEVRDFDQYVICIDGTGRLTCRNRQFLRTCPERKPSDFTTRSFPTPVTNLDEPKSQSSACLPPEPSHEIPHERCLLPSNQQHHLPKPSVSQVPETTVAPPHLDAPLPTSENPNISI